MNKLKINIPGKGKVFLTSIDPAFEEPPYPVTIVATDPESQTFQFEGLFTRNKERIPRKLKKRIKAEWTKWAIHHLTH